MGLDIYHHQWANGIRLVYKQAVGTAVAHCGLMFDIGSRDELPHQKGLAHFWEHMAFKGTSKRKSFHIINRLEALGGELNAYTTKEKVCFHASLLKHHFEKAAELISEIAFDSVFPQAQMEVERGVILEEMAMYYDSLEDAIQDDFDEIIFPNHSLGVNILGTQESVKGFQREDLQEFIDQNLDTHKIVFSVVADLDFDKVLKVCSKYFEHIKEKRSATLRSQPQPASLLKEKMVRSGSQCHVAMGKQSYPLHSSHRVPFFMVNNYLGGPGLNSRFNLTLRERYGYVYGIESGYSAYSDTGIFAIFFATDPKHLKKSMSLVHNEMQKLIDKPLAKSPLHQLKEQIKGQLAMAEEGNMSFMLMMARSILDQGRIESLEEIFTQIDAVTDQQIHQVSNEMFTGLSSLIFVPE